MKALDMYTHPNLKSSMSFTFFLSFNCINLPFQAHMKALRQAEVAELGTYMTDSDSEDGDGDDVVDSFGDSDDDDEEEAKEAEGESTESDDVSNGGDFSSSDDDEPAAPRRKSSRRA
jgi:hypothetical protein